MGQTTKEVDIFVASDSKPKLWRDLSLKRAIQNWNMKYVDIARSPGSASIVSSSSERLATQLKTNEMGEVGKLLKSAPKSGKIGEVGRLVHRVRQMIQKLERMGNRSDLVERSARNVNSTFFSFMCDALE